MAQAFYSVATPIGNLGDITARAVDILSSVDFVVAEDTRHTGQLLAHLGIKKPLLSFRDGPTHVMDRLLAAIRSRLESGESGAYVTDAGTPGISDPGWRLMVMVREVGVTMVPVPGASALTALLSVCHVPIEEYRFIGFLPKKKGYQTKLADIAQYLNGSHDRGVILYESPHRIRRTLTDLSSLGLFYAIVGRELTKRFETIERGVLEQEFIARLPERGEYVILITKGSDLV